MGRGLAAAALLTALLITPTAAQAKGSLLPWPNDALTKRDKTTDTGRRLNLPKALMPRNKNSVPIDPTDMNRADGFSPGSLIIVKVPGLDNPAALAAQQPARARQPRAQPAQELAGRRLQRAHRASATRSGPSSTRTRPPTPHRMLLIRPGQELHGGRALRRRAAQPQERQRRDDHRQAQRSRARLSARCAGPRSSAAVDLPRLVLHRRQRAQPGRARCCTSATTPSPSSGDRNLRDLKVAGKAPKFTIDQGHELHAGAGRQHRPPGRRHDDGAVLPDARPARPAASSRSTSTALPQRHGTTHRRPFTCRIPRVGARPGQPAGGAPVALRPRAARRPRRGQRRQRPRHGERAQLRVLRDGLGRLRLRATSANIVAVDQRLLALPHRRRPHAAGLPQHAAARAPDDPPAGLRRRTPRSRRTAAA